MLLNVTKDKLAEILKSFIFLLRVVSLGNQKKKKKSAMKKIYIYDKILVKREKLKKKIKRKR